MRRLMSALLLIFLICIVPGHSSKYFLENFRNLARDDLRSQVTDQISPSPTPWNAQNPGTCDMVFNKCDIKENNLTACVPFVGNGYPASYLLVLNVGDSSLQLNVTVLPSNDSMDNIVISGHQVKMVLVNLPSNSSSSLRLHVGNGGCLIKIGAPIQASYTCYLTPSNGTYFLFGTAMFLGGTWACFKLQKRERHLDGVPYQELEMDQKESMPILSIETPESWDQNWDDNWD